ncbi:MAG: tyrosine-type recombinase/integrase, partial [Bacteroidota bacterium]
MLENSEAVTTQLIAHLKEMGYPVNDQATGKKRNTFEVLSAERKEALHKFKSYLVGLRLSERTIRTYGTFVRDFLFFTEGTPLAVIGNEAVRTYVERIVAERAYSISSHRQLISAIRHFSFFYPNCSIDPSTLPQPDKSRKLPVVLSQQEIVDLLRSTTNMKHRAVLGLLYSSGLRVGELLNLRLRDIEIDRRQLFVRDGKGRKDRYIILAEGFIPLLKNYVLSYRPQHYFVEGPKGGPYSASSIRKFLDRSRKRARIAKKITPHTLRHSYATHLLENGIGIRQIQELLGHARPETTMIYTHVARKDLLEIQSPLDKNLRSLSEHGKQ